MPKNLLSHRFFFLYELGKQKIISYDFYGSNKEIFVAWLEEKEFLRLNAFTLDVEATLKRKYNRLGEP